MRNMLKEDNILNSRFGKKNHFQVPAGYFDQLTDRVMANLPEQEPRIIHMQPSLGGVCRFERLRRLLLFWLRWEVVRYWR